MERTPLGRLAQIYRTFTKNYRDLDKEAAAESEMTDGAPIYHSDQEQLDKDWDFLNYIRSNEGSYFLPVCYVALQLHFNDELLGMVFCGKQENKKEDKSTLTSTYFLPSPP
ncbi:hypothetical protein Bpfe_011023 [Biomphalaria pfeifferi]|uniref:Uncharacterized protein n=1 Tax=Biomphalaria pfeifferi TaxID=112525 RepID=A0AAD8BRH7_BIOPF|nr:hypothetical protein Bpfe_011023 [Biomphalaria pfeifferi]